MFEKDLYALIRGLRNHKGNEKTYIQNSIKECRKEIRSQDMDQKATALLKLIYLEMFGYDMSWASFHVLEVMSSPKYLQKRVGHLAAIQSFRPDTEVLMLGENLLKKDLGSMSHPTVSLTLATIPHIITPSMANSLLIDLLPRLSHNIPAIRKKTVVTLYRLALLYPETLRPAWPLIKERLLDEQENTSVTAAVVNVVCELGWRRPHDFLPLAPRLFDLLVAGSNNWMAIKIIKLFAVLTPLEPRLIRKLLSPLTNLIRTTPAMSLLYECINGIILGGILDGSAGTVEGDEIARLCVGKLRGMLVVVGDPNLKYVALLALTKIVTSHPDLVSEHSDVILECIDDPDISIRSRVLDLISGMVNSNNLVPLVEQLLHQLRDSRRPTTTCEEDQIRPHEIVPSADSDGEDPSESLRTPDDRSAQSPPLPDDYRTQVIQKILHLCSKDTYANVSDFEWYVGVLVELVSHCPPSQVPLREPDGHVANEIGKELVNIAVRVKSIRAEAAAAAQSLLLVDKRKEMFSDNGADFSDVLGSAAWIAGENVHLVPDSEALLSSLTHASHLQLEPEPLSLIVQAIPKVFVRLTSQHTPAWTPARKSQVVLLAARIIYFLESLVMHPALQVQERAVEYLELMRLASEAATGHDTSPENPQDPPLLFTHAIASLFRGVELNPMAPGALRKVPVADELDLNASLNPDLQALLEEADEGHGITTDENAAWKFYNVQPNVSSSTPAAAADVLQMPSTTKTPAPNTTSRESLARLKAQRREQYRNDPFYIEPQDSSGSASPLHQILQSQNGVELDVDSIPVMNLDLGSSESEQCTKVSPSKRASRKSRTKVDIIADENLAGDDESSDPPISGPVSRTLTPRPKQKALLEVDSSAISTMSLTDDPSDFNPHLDPSQRAEEDAEMRKAIAEVERLRLEMQRNSERVVEGPEQVTVVKRKKKAHTGSKSLSSAGTGDAITKDDNGDQEIKVKKKKKPRTDEEKKARKENKKGREKPVAEKEKEHNDGTEVSESVGHEDQADTSVKPKKKKKNQGINFDETGVA